MLNANYTAGHPNCNTKKDKRYHNKIYFVDNMLTKYQMIKFIDFCEVWFLPKSVARVAAIVGDHASALVQRDFGCVLGVQQTMQLPRVAIVAWVPYHTLPGVAAGDVIWVNHRATMDHMFSINERSGERAGQGSNSIWRLTKNPWTTRATCGRALSC